jgi:hypothetical protein
MRTDPSIEVTSRSLVHNAATDTLLAFIRSRLRLAADPFELHPGGAGVADPVEDLPDAAEVDAAAVAHRRKVPVFEDATIVLYMDVSDQVFDLFRLVAGIGPGIVIGDVARFEIEPG